VSQNRKINRQNRSKYVVKSIIVISFLPAYTQKVKHTHTLVHTHMLAELIVCTRCTISVQHQFKITDSRQDSELHRGAWYTIQYLVRVPYHCARNKRYPRGGLFVVVCRHRESKIPAAKRYRAVGIRAPGCLESNDR
jgi:hypothetical protein